MNQTYALTRVGSNPVAGAKIMTQYRTRIAPSPTGDFHIGTARTAYFNWLAAKATGGTFTLRIDDTDLSRNSEGSVQVIHDCLDWLGLHPDRVVRQSDNIKEYLDVAKVLVRHGRAYYADNGAILMKNATSVAWDDIISGEHHPVQSHQDLAKDQVLIKADGMPVYHFASVIDDLSMGINLIIRGMDHHTNTFRHTAIYDAMGHPIPDFAHVGLITANGKKISKRDAAASLLGYRDAGIDPDAMLNFLLRLGWGPRNDDKSMAIIDKDRAIELFIDAGRMKNTPAAMDLTKLASFDRKYKARKNSCAMSLDA